MPVHSPMSRGKKIILSLNDKMKILDLLKQKPKLGCRSLAERFKEGLRIWNFQGYQRNSMWNFHGSQRNSVWNFQGLIKKMKWNFQG